MSNKSIRFAVACCAAFCCQFLFVLSSALSAPYFTTPSIVPVAGTPALLDVTLADVSGDGKSDVVLADGYSVVHVGTNNGSGGIASWVNYGVGGMGAVTVVGAKLNASDSDQDLVIGSNGDNRLSMLYGNGSGGFLSLPMGPFPADAHAPVSSLSTTPYASIAVNATSVMNLYADLNGDNKQDRLVVSASNDTVSVQLQNVNGGYYTAVSYPVITMTQKSAEPTAIPTTILLADVNNDGKQDIIVPMGARYISVLLGDGAGGVASPLLVPRSGLSPEPINIGDINGDGQNDLIKINSLGDYMLWLGNASGIFSRPALASLAVRGSPKAIVATDINHDTFVDLMAVNSAYSSVYVWRGSNGEFRPPVEYTVGTAPSSLVATDLNGDSYADLVVLNDDSYTVSVLMNDTTGGFSKAVSYQTMTAGQRANDIYAQPSNISVGDFNQDGNSDIAIANGSSSNIALLFGVGNGTFNTPVMVNHSVGFGASSVAVSDINSDGYDDLLAVMPEGGFFVMLGDGIGGFGPSLGYSGAFGSQVAVGPFNADTKPDVVSSSITMTDIYVQLNQGTTDSTPPTGSITIASGASAINTRQFISVAPTCSDVGTGCGLVQVSYNGAAWSNWQNIPISPYTFSWNMPTGDGTKTVAMKFSDLAGHVSAQVNASIILDTQRPASPVITSPTNGTHNNLRPTITGTGEPTVKIIVYDNGIPVVGGVATVSGSGDWTYSYASDISAGVHAFSATAMDAATNVSLVPSGSVSYVIDVAPPIITLLGSGLISIPMGTAFSDPGATVKDNFDIGLTVSVTGVVNIYTAGSYTLTYNASDQAGNAATAATRTVTVLDVTPPLMTRVGSDPYSVSFGSVFSDPGVTVVDNSDTGLTATATGTVNMSKLGSYTRTYNVSDLAGNAATPLTRTFKVVDQTAPVIALNGGNTLNASLGSAFVDPGSVVSDNVDTGLVATVSGSVNTAASGSYSLTYTVSDSSGNTASATRTVSVGDLTPPQIVLTGNDPQLWPLGTAFVDPGSVVTDNVDGSMTATVTGTVNGLALGSYTLTYTATDSASNTSVVTRTVNVKDLTPPVVTLQGANPLTVALGSSFSDPGSTVTDNVSNGLVASVTGTVNTAVAADYLLSYTATDSAGNVTVKQRTVSVVDQTLPMIHLIGSDPYVAQGSSFIDPGVTVSDNYSVGLTASVSGSVNTQLLGTYMLTYRAVDGAGNQAAPVSRTVKVVDQTPPVITLLGGATITIALGSPFQDPGSSVSDNIDIGLVATSSGSVNTAVVGVYSLTYMAMDSAGNSASITRSVMVGDQVKPVITLLGNNPYTLPVGVPFNDPGSTVTDNYSVGLVASVTGSVNKNILGSYTLLYQAVDQAGNNAISVSRVIKVVDSIPPLLQLKGNATLTLSVGNNFVEPGVTVTDNVDFGLPFAVTGVVNMASVGTYTLFYNAVDNSGNSAVQIQRTVKVMDQTSPIVHLVGLSSMTIAQGSTFVDPGTTVTDNVDSGLSAAVVGTVNAAKVGSYTLQYSATDSAGNVSSTVPRIVHVTDQTPPVIALNGGASISVPVGTSFNDPGVTVSDNVDVGLVASVAGNVNWTVLGDYTVTYDVKDGAGNVAVSVNRIVHVIDTQKPVITLLGASSITVPTGGVFVDPGTMVIDNVDFSLIANVYGAVNTSIAGIYTLNYAVTDLSGNVALTVSRIVKVADQSPPTIMLQGAAIMKVSLGGSFVDPGAVVADNVDASPVLNVYGSVNVALVGQYILSYRAIDSAGNVAVQLIRTVNVIDPAVPSTDTTPPVVIPPANITVEATAALTSVSLGTAVVTDNVDNSLIATPSLLGPFSVGVHTVTWSAVDRSGNSNSAVQQVMVVDTTPPVFAGSSLVDIYVAATGVTTPYALISPPVSDAYGVVSVRADNVGPFHIGTTTIIWTATDKQGLTSSATQRVVVQDGTKPVITLNGSNPSQVEVGRSYVDLGATAYDSVDGDLTSQIVTTGTGTVNTSSPGTFTISYNVTDSYANAATQVTRTVRVVDTTPPVFAGSSLVDIYVAATGVTTPYALILPPVSDAYGVVSVRADNVGPFHIGTTTIIWTATDKQGLTSSATQRVVVQDGTKPVITLNGSNPSQVEAGQSYVDLGATAYDSVDGDLTSQIVTTGTGTVHTSFPGTFTISYNVTDSYANAATQVTRTVRVVDTTPPAMTLLGSDPYIIVQGDVFVDPGVVVVDSVDGALTALVNGGVNSAIPGSYIVGYSAVDRSGNVIFATRSVQVKPTPSAITMMMTLKGGWNLVSFPIDLGQNSIATLTTLIRDNYGDLRSIWALSQTGWKSWNVHAPEIATLNGLDTYSGYWLQLAPIANASSIQISLVGTVVASPAALISNGWNLIGVDQTVRNVATYIATKSGTSIWGYKDGMWQSFINGSPPFLNSLQSMQLGKGYYIFR